MIDLATRKNPREFFIRFNLVNSTLRAEVLGCTKNSDE